MESLEISGRTVEEAIQHALDRLGVGREAVAVHVVKEGRSGILGLGSEDAVVRVTPLAPVVDSEVAEIARGVLERLLDLLGVGGSIELLSQPVVAAEKEAGDSILFDIKGDDLGILIGRRGQTLACLQYMVRLIVGRHRAGRVPVVIDVEGYQQRRYQSLQTLARQMAEQAEARGEPYTLRPMSAYERRIIHLALADHPEVTTESIGQGESRRVVILPRKR